MKGHRNIEVMPVIQDPKDFDPKTGTLAEQIVFNNRAIIVSLCIILTVVFGYFAFNLELNANFEKTIPTTHPYIQNYLAHKVDLAGLGNTVRLAVENTKGTIYDAEYLDVLQKINDEVFLVPGVDRMNMRSLWTPATTWTAVTEFGFDGGPVIGNSYDESPEALEEVRRNVERAGKFRYLVALDHKSSLISIPLLSTDPRTDGPLDYGELGRTLEEIREKYQSDKIQIHITGFAKIMGDLIEGVRQVMFFFLIAMVIATAVLYWYSRCPRSTLTVVLCSFVAVIWQLGLSSLLGKDLDPYSVLVPFLVFSIAMSHGAQKMNGILQDVGRGTHKLIAARYTFRRLFLAGLTALVSDTFGFAVLMLIPIMAIRELALIASVGVGVVIFTNLILVPLTLSYIGVSNRAAIRSLVEEEVGRQDKSKHPLFAFLDNFTTKRWATGAVLLSIPLLIFAWHVRKDLRIGDLDRGAPELHADSRYNLDNDFMVKSFGASSDVIALMVTTPLGRCNDYDILMKVDALEYILRQTEGVESTDSLALLNRNTNTALSEGSPKWYDLFPNQSMINFVTQNVVRGYANDSAEMLTVYIYLADHRADTLTRVVRVVEDFAAENDVTWVEKALNDFNNEKGTKEATQMVDALGDFAARNDSKDVSKVVGALENYAAENELGDMTEVSEALKAYAENYGPKGVKFLLAAGSAGIEAATNIVVEQANKWILIWVYTVVILMCFITFRNWRAVICAILPLGLTSIFAEAVMAKMGIGVKVSTLPVVALGVGIGVDYALYILNVVLEHYRAGRSLTESFYRADLFTGKVVLLIGITLSASVATWAWSPIKFQADMGLLLAFMFFVNMLGALLLHPALAYFLYLKGDKRK